MYDVIAAGSATEDVFVLVRQTAVVRFETPDREIAYLGLEYGAKIAVDQVEIMTGGGATNTAATFARMGLKTACLCKLGRDGPGERICAELQSLGVDTSMVAFTDQHRTGYSVIITAFTGERTILTHRGANRHLLWREIDKDKLAATSWLYLGSMRGPAAEIWFKAAEFCKAHGVKLACNPGGTQLRLGLDGLRPVLQACELLILNRQEAGELTGIEPRPGEADEHELLEKLAAAGCKNVVITCGEQGAWGTDGTGVYFVPARKVEKVASTVGAGDAFAAATLVALHRGLGLREAMRIGAANAAGVVQHIGAKQGILTWEEALQAAGISPKTAEGDAAS